MSVCALFDTLLQVSAAVRGVLLECVARELAEARRAARGAGGLPALLEAADK